MFSSLGYLTSKFSHAHDILHDVNNAIFVFAVENTGDPAQKAAG